MLAAFALPSSLILPQASPSTTMEYAPVPPNGQAPPGGNFSGLGLGSSSTLGSNGAGGSALGAPPNTSSSPSTKQCVGNPPRQTEDPLSPPCVPFFNGNNGGSTYAGVSSSQIVVLFYADYWFNYSDCNTAQPAQRYYDISSGDLDGTCVGRNLAVWARYFNDRFQTYNRKVHFWLYYATGATVQDRRADAVASYQRLRPFAVVEATPPFSTKGYNQDAYQQEMNQRGVLYFTAESFEPSSLYQRFAPLLWGYAPSAEEQAKNWATYVCTRIQPYQSVFAGPLLNGRPRRYGTITTTDSTNPLLQQFQSTALHDVASECGIQAYDTATYPVNGYGAYTGSQSASYSRYAAPAMAKFYQENITTILWPGGYENQFSKAASGLHYYPEWVTAGDGVTDGWAGGYYQDTTVWAHDIVVTPQIKLDSLNGSATCMAAYGSVDPGAPAGDIHYGCQWYSAIFQMFEGIQVAGPHINPTAVDQGFHAIPAHPSSNPEVPACFYEPGDYSCVKDGTAMYWSSTTPNRFDPGISGCYLMPQGGARYLSGHWPSGSAETGRSSSDVCNGFEGTYTVFADVPGTG